ncbi:Ribokinase [Caenorhabditis elegans]|uniref:Ribokinase n=1 Tax=Caenorhabditis elegans TaxID=6239 RepID=Q19133_CAEEL|nr:Ribokinase [Caenorhabditis elegans]CAA91318.2 Ribokinase [Caenorhabditis elegans]|eukprot:NP_496483.2 Ribokinase [Caenorhabditis elegans]
MSSENQKIVVFGSIVQDLVSYTDSFPRPGESVRGHNFKLGSGGKGANQAVAAARLGINVSMIGMVGEDMFGDSNIKDLSSNGVDTSCVGRTKKTHTATATITVNKEGENNIVVTLGANLEMSPEIADANSSKIAGSKMVICQGEIDEKGNRRAFEIARSHGVTTFLNPAPGDPNMDKTILELVDIICTNENEAEFITGIAQNNVKDAEKAARAMLKMGPQHAIITLGGKGVLLASKGVDDVEHTAVIKVDAVDTTGAGDCFCGSLAAHLVAGHPISASIRSAANLAALSVTRHGTQSSYWKLDEIRQQYPEFLP